MIDIASILQSNELPLFCRGSKAMLRDQADTPQDALLLENLLIDDLNQESVHRYRIMFNNLKPDHVWGKLADKVGERSGQGLCDVYNNWEINGFKKPGLQETTAPDRITLTLEIEIDSNRESNDSNDDSNLTVNEARVLTALRKNSSLNATQVAAETGLSISTVNRVYKSLKNKNYIARESLTRGKWIILK